MTVHEHIIVCVLCMDEANLYVKPQYKGKTDEFKYHCKCNVCGTVLSTLNEVTCTIEIHRKGRFAFELEAIWD